MRRTLSPPSPFLPAMALLALACLACSGVPTKPPPGTYPGATQPGPDRQPAANDPRFGEIYPGRPPARVEGSRDATLGKIRSNRQVYEREAMQRERARRMQRDARGDRPPPQPALSLETLSVSYEGSACDVDADCLVATLSPCGDDPAALNIGYHQLIGEELQKLHDLAPATCDATVPTPVSTCREGYCQLQGDEVKPRGWSVRTPDEHGGFRYATPDAQQLDRWWGGEQETPFAPRLASPPPPPPSVVDAARAWHQQVDTWHIDGAQRRALEGELARVDAALRDEVTGELERERRLLRDQLAEVPAAQLPPPPTPNAAGLACDQPTDCTSLPSVPCGAAPVAANTAWADAVAGRSRRLQEALACAPVAATPNTSCALGYCRFEAAPAPMGLPERVPDDAGGYRYRDEALEAAARRWEQTLARWSGSGE